MGDLSITRAEIKKGKSWTVTTGSRQRFALRRPALRALELEDVNFHHESAVIMPDYGVDEAGDTEPSDNDASGTGEQVELAGLAVIAEVLRHAKRGTGEKLLIVGHTDTSGKPAYNLDLSRLRARSAMAVLLGDRDQWAKICDERSKVEDYQQILKWVSHTLGWPCDPGEVNNVKNDATTKAVKGFQDYYSNYWDDDSKKVDKIPVDGDVGPKTWGAIFDVYMDVLENLLGVEKEADAQEFRKALKWVDDGTKFVGCGETKPIDHAELQNYKSETNRRVEFLFFAEGHEPEMPLECHPSEKKCSPDDCPIYWKYDRTYMPVEPALIPRSAYRITLSLGKIDDLFPSKPDTVAGRMARLQVVGLFYFPLAQAQAQNAFNGLAATAANPATGHPGDQAFIGTWSYFKTDIVEGKSAAAPATDAEADADIQERLRTFVVEDGTLPDPVESGEEPHAAKNFRKLRMPGGFTFVDGIGTGLDTNRDPAYAMAMGDPQFAVEDLYYRDNPILGKLPLVAKVEARHRSTGEFQAVKDVTVYFQLVPTDPLPAYDPALPANGQINRPNLRGSNAGGPADPSFNAAGGQVVAAEPAVAQANSGVGPLLRYTTEEARNPDPNDPQGTNCHRTCGGKRGQGDAADGSDVADVIFETTSRAGFNTAHADRDLGHTPYPLAEKVSPDGDKHKHAVRAATNEDGEAGVIFMPSRMGGDTYRLRVYIGPSTLPSDGTDDGAVKVETGTFVVWRNLRLSRYYQVVPGNPDAALLAEAGPYNIANNNAYRRRALVHVTPPLNNGSWGAVEGNPPPNFAGPIVMWARAWCEFVVDRNALSGGNPLQVTAAQYTAARRQALADGIANQGTAGTSYNLANLLYMDATSPNLTPTTGLCNIPMRTAETYNAMPTTTGPQKMPMQGGGQPGANPTHRSLVDQLTKNFLLRGFARSLSQNGFMPGFTVIQSALGWTWQLTGQNRGFSGIAVNFNAGFLWYGRAAYINAVAIPPPAPSFSYGYDSNMIHEMGHCHYREHGPGRNPRPSTPAGGNKPAKHDQLQTGICVMSYKSCEGDFCGMCTMGLRGWDIRAMTP